MVHEQPLAGQNDPMPPYLAVHAYSVALLIPCLRHTSAVFIPPSCSRRTAMICSSLNLVFFTSVYGATITISGARQLG